MSDMDNRKVLAIIPARSGSKGLPNKNIMPLNGKPLLAYSVEAAVQSELFDTIHVSTDSEKYSEIAASYGSDQPFLRSELNSGDSASSWDVVRETISKYEDMGRTFDLCVLLQPTSPLRTADDIRGALELYLEKGARAVTSVTEVEHPVEWCFPLDENGSMSSFAASPFKYCRRQELSVSYRENGAIYIVSIEDIMNPEFEFYSSDCYAYVMDSGRSIDIDTETDFRIAEVLLHEVQKEI